MKKPMIALTPRTTKINSNQLLYDFDSYFTAIIQAGGIPCLISYDLLANPQDCLDNFDGLLVTGGEDINPKYYHQEAYDNLVLTEDFIDKNEIALIKLFYENNKPIFGICRGVQSLNVAFNGNLYQDLQKDLKIERKKHVQNYQPDMVIDKSKPYHQVVFNPNNFIYDIFNKQYGVNSFHHQAINKVAKNFEVVAKSDDGVIEAIIDKNKPVF